MSEVPLYCPPPPPPAPAQRRCSQGCVLKLLLMSEVPLYSHLRSPTQAGAMGGMDFLGADPIGGVLGGLGQLGASFPFGGAATDDKDKPKP